MMQVSKTYLGMAEKITGQRIHLPENPKSEIVEILRSRYGLID
jgi:phosphoribosylaminoimidazole-succinocarboxamide synthase